jgi:hypothetical protein
MRAEALPNPYGSRRSRVSGGVEHDAIRWNRLIVSFSRIKSLSALGPQNRHLLLRNAL